MPLNPSIKKVLVIGSGPIVIGQAAEFDYAGVQACRALKEDGIEIVLVNSNPATIMTDAVMADRIYIEPLTLTTIQRIIEKEKPDSILSGLGGQTGLTLSMQLAKSGFLAEHNVRLIGSFPETIDKAEDRQMFKDTMESIGQPCIPSKVVTAVEDALAFAEEIGYPVIVRPAFTLGGTGGGMAADRAALKEIAHGGIAASPIGQILIEKSVAGWKEIEFETMRDHTGRAIIVCSMENVDPVGVHTGDSIVVAPAITLTNEVLTKLRNAALAIVEALGVEGGCNVQLALHPETDEYAVIEVNPRVSRSSALASKATGYPIAKISTKVALGYTLDEIPNVMTGITTAADEPEVDYVALKFPKWPFDKFVYAKRTLGTQMKATGEVMSIGDTFEAAIMKAVRGAEISLDTLNLKAAAAMSDDELYTAMAEATDQRFFFVYEAIKRAVKAGDYRKCAECTAAYKGAGSLNKNAAAKEGRCASACVIGKVYAATAINPWFLDRLANLAAFELELEAQKSGTLSRELYVKGKKLGYLDSTLKRLSGCEMPFRMAPVYKMVDTCAGKYDALTPYFYSVYRDENDAPIKHATVEKDPAKPTVMVFGSGPIRIGQGIEFDYASVHCVKILKELGYTVVIVNNNPETVSTDFDISDRLYFEPLNIEDVMHVIDVEKPVGAVVAFGGQTAIKLTKKLNEAGINIIGTSADSIDMAEDRERFDELLERLKIHRAKGFTVMTLEEALSAAKELTYPVLMRPSYVLGGQNMVIAFSDDDIKEYMAIILAQNIENPVLIDKYIEGREIEVDAIYDGKDVLLPGIMEHVERTGIHSGDSIAMYPAAHIDDAMAAYIETTTKYLCEGLNSIGIFNIQYIIRDGELYVIEVNPRASRTVPYLSKVTGVPMVDLAMRVSLGEKLADLGYGTGLYRKPIYTAVKVPVFSFEKLIDVDTHLGPEMKSTGEVLGLGRNLHEALYKGLIGAGYKMHKKGGVFITVRDTDKHEVPEIARKFMSAGFDIYATAGTAEVLKHAGIEAALVEKIHMKSGDASCGMDGMELIESGLVQYILSTSTKGRLPALDSVKLRRRACALGIPCMTSIDTAGALADSLLSRYSEYNTELVDINNKRNVKRNMAFTKMNTCGNDFIYIDCFDQNIESPESLSVELCDRHKSIGGDGIVLIKRSGVADAQMIMYNKDGSEGPVAGNAMRCVAKYMHDVKGIRGNHISIETRNGVKQVRVFTQEGTVVSAQIDMGTPKFAPKEIPVKADGEIINKKVKVAGGEYEITCLSMGNPHCVVFGNDPDGIDIDKIGPMFENDPLFPERVNTEFIKVVDEHTIKARFWERGSGATLACGTGACAAAVAAVEGGMCRKGSEIRVMVPGGELFVTYAEDGKVSLKGNAEFAFNGVVQI